jgi:Domain of unknown function (DUF1905)
MADDGTIRFHGRIRFWDPPRGSGMAVVDVPDELVATLGGRKQYRVAGTLGGHRSAGAGCSLSDALVPVDAFLTPARRGSSAWIACRPRSAGRVCVPVDCSTDRHLPSTAPASASGVST